MIKKYDDFWEFIKEVRTLKNTIILVPEHFKNYAVLGVFCIFAVPFC